MICKAQKCWEITIRKELSLNGKFELTVIFKKREDFLASINLSFGSQYTAETNHEPCRKLCSSHSMILDNVSYLDGAIGEKTTAAIISKVILACIAIVSVISQRVILKTDFTLARYLKEWSVSSRRTLRLLCIHVKTYFAKRISQQIILLRSFLWFL